MKFYIDWKDLKFMNYLKKFYNVRKTWMNIRRSAKGIPAETYAGFEAKVLLRLNGGKPGGSLSSYTRAEIKRAAQGILRTRVYMSDAEVMHKNVIDQLKERKLYNKVYRLGGSTDIAKQGWTKKAMTKTINGEVYNATGEYSLGGVSLIFWAPTDSLSATKIELGGVIY